MKPIFGTMGSLGLFAAICYTAPAELTTDNAPILMLLVLLFLLFAAGFFAYPAIMQAFDLRQVAEDLQQPAQQPSGSFVSKVAFPWQQ